jgi:hypothetical protein
MPLGLAIEDNMRASLCCHTLENAKKAYPASPDVLFTPTEEVSTQVQNIVQ